MLPRNSFLLIGDGPNQLCGHFSRKWKCQASKSYSSIAIGQSRRTHLLLILNHTRCVSSSKKSRAFYYVITSFKIDTVAGLLPPQKHCNRLALNILTLGVTISFRGVMGVWSYMVILSDQCIHQPTKIALNHIDVQMIAWTNVHYQYVVHVVITNY